MKNSRICAKEEYFSVSKKNILRGLHYQDAPHDCNKLVYCAYGKIQDVIVDLRINSGTYGKANSFILSDKNKKSIFVPKGFAHGFLSLSENSIVVYKTDKDYNRDSDKGINWQSFRDVWMLSEDIIVSDRDNSFIYFKDFNSNFLIWK